MYLIHLFVLRICYCFADYKLIYTGTVFLFSVCILYIYMKMSIALKWVGQTNDK